MEVSGQLHALAVYRQGKNPDTHWIGGWDAVVKRKFPSPPRDSKPRSFSSSPTDLSWLPILGRYISKLDSCYIAYCRYRIAILIEVRYMSSKMKLTDWQRDRHDFPILRSLLALRANNAQKVLWTAHLSAHWNSTV